MDVQWSFVRTRSAPCKTNPCSAGADSLRMLTFVPTKLYIDTSTPADAALEFDDPPPPSHPFAGYFLPHPDHSWGWKGEGLVSTITDDPPQLNWIYVDKDTNELKYGTKLESNPHIVGPFNCTKIDRRMTFDGWEGFIAVQEERDVWALYFDVEDDGLKGKVEGKRMLEVELTRKERRKGRENRDDKDYV